MNDLSDNEATQFLLKTEAGNDDLPIETRAIATVVGAKMWKECRRRAEERDRKAFEAGWKAGCIEADTFEGEWRTYREQQK